jgi:hypothetical protein
VSSGLIHGHEPSGRSGHVGPYHRRDAAIPHRTDQGRRILRRVAQKPTAGWALRRGQLVHGMDDPLDYLVSLRDYSLAGRAEAITCPTFVCHAEGDDIGASAPRLAEALTCDKQ